MTLCRKPGLFILSFLLIGASFAEDKVTLNNKNKDVLHGKVKKDDADGVQIEIKAPGGNAATVTKSAAEVLEIDWDINDEDWRLGISDFRNGSYGRAAESFQKIISVKESVDKFRPEARPYLFYVNGEALFRMGKAKDSIDAFEKFLTDYKTSRYVSSAVASAVEAAVISKNFDKVPKLLEQMRALSTESRALADYYEGQMLLAQNKVRDAENRFGAAFTAASPLTKGMALLGQAQCAVEDKNHSKARQLAQQALTLTINPKIAAPAHIVIGESILDDIEQKKVPTDGVENALTDALLEFMRVQLQYAGDPKTEPKAYLKAGECLQKLSQYSTRAGDKDRAVAMYAKLTQDPRYKNSSWAAKAVENMNKMNER